MHFEQAQQTVRHDAEKPRVPDVRIERDHRVCFDPRLDLDARTPERVVDDLPVLPVTRQKTQGQARRGFPAHGRGHIRQAALAREEKVTLAVQRHDVETRQALVLEIRELAREAQPSVAIGDVKLQATWNDAEVVFLAKGDGPFLLAYGNASAQPSTTVLGSLLDGIVVSPARADRAHPLGGAERLQPPPRTVPWKLAVLWVVLGGGVMLLAWMAYRLSREVGAR